MEEQADFPRHHVHHSYIWLNSVKTVFTILFALAISSFATIANVFTSGGSTFSLVLNLGIIVGAFIVLVGVAALSLWWSYKHLYYQLSEEEFNLYSGIFNKKRVHVPYTRIQSVDQKASLLQRIFGVCTLNIDTAGGASNNAVQVPYVSKEQAEDLRRQLFERKNQTQVQKNAVASATAGATGNVLDAPAELWQEVRGVFGGVDANTGNVTYEHGLTNKELIFTGLSNNTAFIIVVVGILSVVSQLFDMVGGTDGGLMDSAIDGASVVAQNAFGNNLLAMGVVAFLFFSIVLWAGSAIGSCISFGGFKARRRDNRIEVEHGLLQHQLQGVDINRVQYIAIKQSFIRRLMGYCELSLGKIDAAKNTEDAQKSNLNTRGVIIHPFVKMDRVPEILGGLAPEFADIPQKSISLAPVALRRAVIRRCVLQGLGFWLAVVCAIMQVTVSVASASNADLAAVASYINSASLMMYGVCVAIAIIELVGAVLWVRGSSFAYNRQFMQISNGGFSRESITFPRRKLQYGTIRSNPFQRKAHTVTIGVRTAAGIGGTTTNLIDVDKQDAQKWYIWMHPRRSMIE